MSTAKKTSTPFNITAEAQDERYPLPVIIRNGAEIIDKYMLYFNPADPSVIIYADNIQNIKAPESETAEFLSFAKELEGNIDAIFGNGSARKILRYNGANNYLLNSIMENVRKGYEDFKEKSESAAKEAKVQAVIDAKKEAAQFKTSQ